MKYTILFLTLLILSFIQSVMSSPIEINLERRFFGFDDQPQVDEPEPDWNSLNFNEIKIDTKEIEMKPNELYSEIEDCVQKCMKEVDSDKSYRDNCLAKMCDVY